MFKETIARGAIHVTFNNLSHINKCFKLLTPFGQTPNGVILTLG